MKRAFIFPGQGAQFVGMGRDFYDNFEKARAIFDQADEILGRPLSRIIFEGPEEELTRTVNSQPAIFVMSVAVLACLDLNPDVVAGLSLGEYTALVASGRLTFEEGLQLVQFRASSMQEACEKTEGTMAAIVGLSAEQVEEVVKRVADPELWVANFNCPGQTVISGSREGVERGMEALKEAGAKRCLPLQVSGAFHSGLMQSAQDKLAEKINATEIADSEVALVMNVPGDFVEDKAQIRQNMINQVTSSVCWEQGIRKMADVELFYEIGCGKTLAGMNRKIGAAKTISIGKVEDLEDVDAQG
ncbi:MAG: Malonyl CoA-acyl carrier protein transacylase [Chlamydiales bacterium]|nr:Malonyl CoA-acyl carrier protein transacylase [Chlamydiales bacterium]MCH9636129.1 Malonyl CoA-acyl carrier protein transacylase [Chlamydiales bacterium]MCH9703263.1 ACP S-malonyltransferase [Chlamydiota bacterium]